MAISLKLKVLLLMCECGGRLLITILNLFTMYLNFTSVRKCVGLHVYMSINLVAIPLLLISESSHTIIKCDLGTCLSISLDLSSCYVLISSSLSYLCELEIS